MVYCSQCGTKNNQKDNVCKNCESILIKPEYFGYPTYNDFDQLFTEKNKKILNEMSFSVSAYNTILHNIYNQAMNNYINIREDISQEDYQKMDVLSKVALITHAFAKVNSKSRGGALGDYSYNLIRVDDRLDDIHQATTLIHELTHHLFSEIFEQTLMYLLEVKKSDVIESYVDFVLKSDPSFVLMNEFCAHTVEGRFVPHGYQGFGSFLNLREKYFDMDDEKVYNLVYDRCVFGNSIATDILRILEQFITPDLRNEIIDQYMDEAKFPPQYSQIGLEIEEELPEPLKVFLINLLLNSLFEQAQEADSAGVLDQFKNYFNMVNKG